MKETIKNTYPNRFSNLLLLLFSAYFMLWGNFSSAGEIILEAPDYVNKTVTIEIFEDYISQNRKVIKTVSIPKSGKVKIKLDNDQTEEYILDIEGKHGVIYLQKDAQLKVFFPPTNEEDMQTFVKKSTFVELVFQDLSEDDINYKLIEFQTHLDKFWYDHYYMFKNDTISIAIDTFKYNMAERYKEFEDPYFKTFLGYSIADMEFATGFNVRPEANFFYIYGQYLNGKKIHYRNYVQMDFIQKFYDGVFSNPTFSGNDTIQKCINFYRSYSAIDKFLATDILMKNERLRELAIMINLSSIYGNQGYNKYGVVAILDSIQNTTEFDEHKVIARNLINNLTHLEVGFKAPSFNLKSSKDTLVSLDDFSGKYVYLYFFTSWCKPCLEDMALIPRLKENYGEDITFVGISIDQNKSDFDAFVQAYKYYNWHLLHWENDKEVKERYDIRSLPTYFLIDPEGNLIQSPALAPTPNGNFVSIDKSFYLIHKELHPTSRWKPGDMNDR